MKKIQMKKWGKGILAGFLLTTALFSTRESVMAAEKNNLPIRWQGTQTIGDAAMLTIRVEFDDIKFQDGCYTADQLASMIDGTETADFADADLGVYASLQEYYERSSFGKLHISSGDQIYSYTLSHERAYYEEQGGDQLIKEVLTGLDEQIDYEDYDLDQDGYIDGICINFAGANDGRDSLWWSHVSWYQDLCKTEFDDPELGEIDTWDGKKVANYMFLHTLLDGETNQVNTIDTEGHRTLIHEMGHMLGLDDYYNSDNADNGICTQDMMCYNEGEHNGFSKWLLGWIDEEQILWLTKDSVGEDGIKIQLTALSTEEPAADDKLIAVIAPTKSETANGLYSEYFVVEYDENGVGNYNGTTGFRVFHVDAHLDEAEYGFLNSNTSGFGNRLIYAVSKVSEDVLQDEVFVPGDSLTSETKESSAFYGGDVKGFTGITLTDFHLKTAENDASVHLSFAEKTGIDGTISFVADRKKVGNMGRICLIGDKPLTQNYELTETAYYMDSDGNMYPASVQVSYSNEYEIEVLCRNFQENPLKPNTGYTLVIPAGMFQIDEDVYSKECKIPVTTGSFPTIIKNHNYPYGEDDLLHSNLFSMSENRAGKICVKQREGYWNGILYIYSGKEYSQVSQSLAYPEGISDISEVYISSAEGWQEDDGSIVLAIMAYYGGSQVSYIYHITDFEQETPVKPYVINDSVVLLPADHGIRAVTNTLNSDETLSVYQIDFNLEPYTVSVQDFIYFPTEELSICAIDKNTYAVINPSICVNIYDQDNDLLYSLSWEEFDFRRIYTVTKVGSSIAVVHSVMAESAEGKSMELVVGISAFDENGALIETKVLPADTDLSYIKSLTATGFGYHMVSVLLDGSAVHTFLNKDLEVITSVETSSNDGCAMGDQFVFSGNTINGTVISITGSVVKNESDQEEDQNGTDDGQTPNNGSGSENSSDNTSNKENTVNGGKSPKTGDTAPILCYLFIGLISVAVILKKRQRVI